MSAASKGKDSAEVRRQQATSIKSAKKRAGALSVGQTHFIISAAWHKKWTSYAVDSSPESGPPEAVDNQSIIDAESPKGDPQLRPKLEEHEDYEIISEYEWKFFLEWYGGGPAIQRNVIAEGENGDVKRVEVVLMDLLLTPCKKDGTPDVSASKKIFVSKHTLLKELLLKASSLLGYRPLSIRLWNFEDADKAVMMSDLDRSLVDEEIVYGQTVLVEKQKKAGVWPRDRIAGKAPAKKSRSIFARILGLNGQSEAASAPGSPKGGDRAPAKDDIPLGLCGLRNLGNTCFMNSALQCLSNTTPLRQYFLDDTFRDEINKNNPLGMKGQVADQFGTLLKQIWSGEDDVLSPKSFKHTISKFAPQFEGFNQHDAHELLSFVLDGLHEDLNRVQKKPYVEKKEGNGRPDPEVALEAWDGHLRRNKSVVVDLFHGLLKSTVTCPVCSKEAERPIEVIFLRHRERKTPYKYGPRVSKHGKVADVLEALSTTVQVPPRQIILAFIQDFRIEYVYAENDPTSKIDAGEFLVGYEIPEGPSYIHLRGLHRRQRKRRSVAFGGSAYESFGIPFLFSIIPGETTGMDLYSFAWTKCQRFIMLPAPENDENGAADSEASSSEVDSASYKTNRKRARIVGEPSWSSSNLPFRLCLVTTSGSHCARCGNGCDGCYLEPTSNPITLPKDTKLSIALDWEDAVLENNFDDDEALSVRLHKSVSESRKEYSQKTQMSLNDCLKLFTTTERLGSNDLWFCPECKEHRRAWKKFDIWSLPEVLVIHLKRFQFNRNFRTKLTVDVDFPINALNLDPYVINPDAKGEVYDLYGISNHLGGLGGGHYTAYCWNPNTRQWFGFNDSMVTPVHNPENIKSSAAYLLFYRRRPKGQVDSLCPTISRPKKRAEDSGGDGSRSSKGEEGSRASKGSKQSDDVGVGAGKKVDSPASSTPGTPSSRRSKHKTQASTSSKASSTDDKKSSRGDETPTDAKQDG